MFRCGPSNEAYTVYAKSGDPLIQTVRNTATHGQQERNSAGEYALVARREIAVTHSKYLHTPCYSSSTATLCERKAEKQISG